MFRGAALTYREINERANRLAHHVRARIGAAPAGSGCWSSGRWTCWSALLAVWKAGCAYVPLDPCHPAGRLRYILSDAECRLVAAAAPVAELPAGGRRVIDIVRGAWHDRLQAGGAACPRPAPAEASAYVIYTSGSTGSPKGVEVSQRSLVNLLCSMAERPGSDGRRHASRDDDDRLRYRGFGAFPAACRSAATVAIAERGDVV